MENAPNEIYLLYKVVLGDECFWGVKMTILDIDGKGSVLLVKMPDADTLTSKSFTIIDEDRWK